MKGCTRCRGARTAAPHVRREHVYRYETSAEDAEAKGAEDLHFRFRKSRRGGGSAGEQGTRTVTCRLENDSAY